MKQKDTFIMQKKYRKRFERWGAEKGYAILMAMFEYEETGEVNLPEEYYDAFEPIKEDMDAMREKWEEVCERNRQNGQNGGRPKKNNDTEWDNNEPKETQKTHSVFEKPKKADNDNDNDNDNDYLKKKYNKKETDLLFNQFWSAYPRKVGKKTAYKTFIKLGVDDLLLDKMLKAIEAWSKTEQWQDAQFIPHASTWLNREGWNDEPPKAKKQKGLNYMQRDNPINERFGTDYMYRSSG